jgi:hypothetical protein
MKMRQLAALIGICAFAGTALAGPLYYESFDNTTGETIYDAAAGDAVGWQSIAVGGWYADGLEVGTGMPASEGPGFWSRYNSANPDVPNYLMIFTDEDDPGCTTGELGGIEFYAIARGHSNVDLAPVIAPALKVDGTWYVHSSPVEVAAGIRGISGDMMALRQFDVPAEWYTIPDTGTLEASAATSALPDGAIEEAGMWMMHDSRQEKYFVDGFALNPIPEPMTLGLLAMGGLAVIRRKR